MDRKRAFDLVVTVPALLVSLPVQAVVALAVRATLGSPVLFEQQRPGLDGVPFTMRKFRTMRPPDPATGLATDAERLTPFGSFLRSTSLDELPTLWNIVRGEMSLVGPRPLPQRDFDQLEDWHKKRYLVTPGITGLWQVSGRSELDFDDLVRLDFLYLERWSVFLDLSILVKTIPAVFSSRGAF